VVLIFSHLKWSCLLGSHCPRPFFFLITVKQNFFAGISEENASVFNEILMKH
jgi:hypothetical protein